MVRSILRPPKSQIRQWEKNQIPPIRIRSGYFYHELSYIRLLLMIQLQILVGVLDIGHLGSPEVTNRFLLMTHD